MKRVKIGTRNAWEGVKIDRLLPNEIFVFGSNTQGRHGRGAALEAKQKYGAIYGRAAGIQGQSYAIITKDLTQKKHPSVSLSFIQGQIWNLYEYAEEHPDKKFYISWKMGTNLLSDYLPIEIAYCFLPRKNQEIPKNIIFEVGFLLVLSKLKDSEKRIILSGNINDYLPIHVTLDVFKKILNRVSKDLKIEVGEFCICSSQFSGDLYLGNNGIGFKYDSNYAEELNSGVVIMRASTTDITISMLVN